MGPGERLRFGGPKIGCFRLNFFNNGQEKTDFRAKTVAKSGQNLSLKKLILKPVKRDCGLLAKFIIFT
jgi:hypothetical protein